ncbi:MAG: S41 family peptidase [Acidobacteria bacterium]|nr:S41 family peptidase [Acidobacteriota bacterium]MCG2817186.1 S41 family peptidase [Candidatus Aminicenantes bacterium]MBU1475339.1 S41 family peptidase [Acidobacteriota bacterium]MBU4203142.1 S41 family peptidase [Acidobacteriota bacterium]MBU4254039.1 S41 family peptidase [Acidobacteriota bacterium]
MKRKIALFVVMLSVLLVLPASLEDDWSRLVKKMSNLITMIEDNYYQDVDHEEMAFSSIRGMLQTLDPHSYFLDPRQLMVMQEDYQGKYSGLGILIQKHDTRLVVISPIEGTPAYRLGIRSGDVISHINGESTENISSYDAMLILRGEKGTTVEITIIRAGLDKPIHLTIKREEIPLFSVPYAFLLNDDTGYIFIRNFAATTTQEFKEKMKTLVGQGMTKLILDMRGNTGGTFAESVKLSDEFLPKGKKIVSIRGRDSTFNREFAALSGKQYEDIPLVILINQGTASAPEIVSGAIKDNDRGLIVGEDSWGKGLVQTVFSLADNAAIALTTAKYYTPSGISIQRDYSSFEDYRYYRPEAPEEERQVGYTSGGRKVLGQGGISPDYTVTDDFKPLTSSLLLKGAFFGYARNFADRKTPLSKSAVFPGQGNGKTASSEQAIVFDGRFSVNDRILDDFKLYLLEEKIDFENGGFVVAVDQIRQWLGRELISSVYDDIELGIRFYMQRDGTVRKALDVMPEAENLLRSP